MDQGVCEVMQMLREQELPPPGNLQAIAYESTCQAKQTQTIPPHQNSEPQSATGSKAAHTRLIRALTELTGLADFPSLVIASPAMLELILAIEDARDSRAPALITGETGTGKELLALAAHALSNRRSREFRPFNCAVNSELIESELFGYRRGSFTGATGDYTGIIREADGGTLFLDEIGELPLNAQPKLLRFLQEGEVRPVGAPRPVKTDVRVIAATSRNLEWDVHLGRFRADLYERLNLLRLHVPPLRERREEIPLLIAHFLDRYQQEEHRQGLRLDDEVMELLLGYDWPRNVRQLANEVHRLALRSGNGEVIGAERLSPEIRANACPTPSPPAEIIAGRIMIDLSLPYREARDEMERQYIINALKQTNGNQQQAAAKMGMSRVGFMKAIKRLGIEAEKRRQPHE